MGAGLDGGADLAGRRPAAVVVADPATWPAAPAAWPCPECGAPVASHTGWGGPDGCTLTDDGAAQRAYRIRDRWAREQRAARLAAEAPSAAPPPRRGPFTAEQAVAHLQTCYAGPGRVVVVRFPAEIGDDTAKAYLQALDAGMKAVDLSGTLVLVAWGDTALSIDHLEDERMADLGWQRIVVDEPARCRVCGCTDDDCSQCVEASGEPCSWAEPDLCSRCA